MSQNIQESDLQTQIDELNVSQEEYANNVQTYKRQIADAITSQGIPTSENDEGSVIATNINGILTAKTSDVTDEMTDAVFEKVMKALNEELGAQMRA